jgi:hypothetical protein
MNSPIEVRRLLYHFAPNFLGSFSDGTTEPLKDGDMKAGKQKPFPITQ